MFTLRNSGHLLVLVISFLFNALTTSATDAHTSTPPMGWNSYNAYNCFATESDIILNSQALVDLALADLGYVYVIPDCGWSSADRTSNGTITWNTTYYPSGLPALGDQIHDLGLKFGVYSGAGTFECGRDDPLIQASEGHEGSDIVTFASWGADYLKYDNCWAYGEAEVNYTGEADPSVRFRAMATALNEVDRDIVYGICQWGVGIDLVNWTSQTGNNWRMSNDISNNWISIWRITNQVVPLASFSQPGNYNDMDMLMVGNGVLTPEESRTHFSIWAMEKSPLFLGAAMAGSGMIDNTSLTIISNKAIIDINKDPLGKAALLKRRFTEEAYDIWAGELSEGRTLLAVINWGIEEGTFVIDLPDAGLQSAGTAIDVWEDEEVGALEGTYTAVVPGHGIKLLVLGDTMPTASPLLGQFDNNTTTTFTNVYARTSTLYTLNITLNTSNSGEQRVVNITLPNNTTIMAGASGSTYLIPSIPLPAGQNNLSISDPLGKINTLSFSTPDSKFYPATDAILEGNATLIPCDVGISGACVPVGSKITNLNTTSDSVTFRNIASLTTGSLWVELHYINFILAFDTAWDGTGTNILNASFTVNDANAGWWSFPISGADWSDTGKMGVLLDGFVEGSENEVKIGVPGWFVAPEVVGIEIWG